MILSIKKTKELSALLKETGGKKEFGEALKDRKLAPDTIKNYYHAVVKYDKNPFSAKYIQTSTKGQAKPRYIKTEDDTIKEIIHRNSENLSSAFDEVAALLNRSSCSIRNRFEQLKKDPNNFMVGVGSPLGFIPNRKNSKRDEDGNKPIQHYSKFGLQLKFFLSSSPEVQKQLIKDTEEFLETAKKALV